MPTIAESINNNFDFMKRNADQIIVDINDLENNIRRNRGGVVSGPIMLAQIENTVYHTMLDLCNIAKDIGTTLHVCDNQPLAQRMESLVEYTSTYVGLLGVYSTVTQIYTDYCRIFPMTEV